MSGVQLDDTDRDAATLAEDTVAAVRHLRADFQSIVPSLTAQRGTEAVALASALARDIASAFDDYVILVLDNFHLVQDSEEAMRFMDAFVPELPEQIHLLIAGRAIPDSPVFTHLAITDQIAGIDEDYLRFTPEEVQALLQQRHNLEMPRLVAEELTANTEGWITAILMSTYSMWRGMTASAAQARQSESVYGFLAEEVLDQQPSPMKTFLLESSVLPDMDVEICNEVLERTDSAHFLKQAEERHLFVNTVGDEFRAYQYHNPLPRFPERQTAISRPPAFSRHPKTRRRLVLRAGHDRSGSDFLCDGRMCGASNTNYRGASGEDVRHRALCHFGALGRSTWGTRF